MVRSKNVRGFTIIEVVLFLTISGLLAALLLGGWTVRINTERYRDSVASLQSFLQQQYSLIYNTENERSDALSCDSGTAAVTQPPAGGQARGQTDCVLLGRYLTLTHGSDGATIAVQPIVGIDAAVDSGDNRPVEAVLRETYRASVVSQSIGLSENEFSIPWGAKIVGADGATKDYSIAIIRSPLGGNRVYTYVKPGLSGINELLGASASSDTGLCIASDDAFVGGNMSIILKAKASSQSSIESQSGCDA